MKTFKAALITAALGLAALTLWQLPVLHVTPTVHEVTAGGVRGTMVTREFRLAPAPTVHELLEIPPVKRAGFDFLGFLTQPAIVNLLTLGVGSWLATRIIKPRDHEKALALDAIAKGAAALVLASSPPGARWATLIDQVVRQISAATGLPTSNSFAIQRAAAAALVASGVKPSNGT